MAYLSLSCTHPFCLTCIKIQYISSGFFPFHLMSKSTQDIKTYQCCTWRNLMAELIILNCTPKCTVPELDLDSPPLFLDSYCADITFFSLTGIQKYLFIFQCQTENCVQGAVAPLLGHMLNRLQFCSVELLPGLTSVQSSKQRQEIMWCSIQLRCWYSSRNLCKYWSGHRN